MTLALDTVFIVLEDSNRYVLKEQRNQGISMDPYKATVTARQRGRIVIAETPFDPGQIVEVVMISQKHPRTGTPHTAHAILASGVVGFWKDRTDIEDSVQYARELRRQGEQRPIRE